MRYVIFDFDGTLADSLPVVIQLAKELVPNFDLSDQEIAKLRNMPARDIIKYSGIPYWRLARLLLKGKRLLTKRLGELEIFPGIADVLQQLHKQGYEIAVVSSNSEENIRKVLTDQKVNRYVHSVYGNIGLFNKARAFKVVLRDQNVLPQDALYVGDEVRDIEAARRGRIPMVAVTWGYNGEKILQKYKPTYIAHTPKELLKVITTHHKAA